MKKVFLLFLISALLMGFFTDVEAEKKSAGSVEKKADEELLKMMLNSFLWSKDLKNAYRVAKKGVKLFPSSKFWLRKAGDLSLWLSKPEEALKYYLRLYSLDKEEKLRDKIIKLSLQLRKYHVAKKLMEEEIQSGKINRWKILVQIYELLGEPEKALNLLKNLYRKYKDVKYLKEIIRIELLIGQLKEAYRNLDYLERIGKLDYRYAVYLSKMLYQKKRYRDSLNILLQFKSSVPDDDVSYWKLVSDIGWGIGDFRSSFYASKKLINTGKGRDVDYERVVLYLTSQGRKNYEEIYRLSYEGWKRYKKEVFLYYTLDSLYRMKKYKKIIHLVENLKEDKKYTLNRYPYLWVYYSSSLEKIGSYQRAVDAYERALKIFPENNDIIVSFLWMLIEHQDIKRLKLYLKRFRGIENKNRALNAVLVAGYVTIQNSSAALPLVAELLKENPDNPDVLMLFAEVLYLSGDEERAESYRWKAYKVMKREIIAYPEKLKDKEFLKNFLYLSFYFEAGEHVEKLLSIAKRILKQDEYYKLKITWLLVRNQPQPAEYILMRLRKAEPWMLLNVYLTNYDRYKINTLLKHSLYRLPIRDRVEGALRVGRVNFSQELAFRGLEENRNDALLYKQMRDIIMENNSSVEFSNLLRDREKNAFLRNSFFIKKYIKKNYFIKFSADNDITLSKNGNIFTNLPSNYSDLKLSFGRNLSKYRYEFGISYLDGLSSSAGFFASLETYIYNRLRLGMNTGLSQRADETVYLFYGGLKDYINPYLNFRIGERLFFEGDIDFSKYKTANGDSLGSGTVFTGRSYYKLRVGYPDFTFGVYTGFGVFHEKAEKGIINSISKHYNPDVLPENYCESGVDFSFGYEHKYYYTGLFRPFFSGTVFYNCITGTGFGMEIGIGGHIFQQDHISGGLRYFQGMQGTNDYIREIFINYRLWF
ncbi:tetratricopeptide repeat protein [Persephonella atlantica]|uniref:Tetratricopeptide repeat protein n=1 Tax=Persephonella atlantica TaxID=2699429 RepID=A0ABS1GHH5_9AQUI|nr:tetratricopeptide repeat protein [Persephonella atlantica]MBK3332330.1 tetratricopeptide repeat protein [Persephonella atlantica]